MLLCVGAQNNAWYKFESHSKVEMDTDRQRDSEQMLLRLKEVRREEKTPEWRANRGGR